MNWFKYNGEKLETGRYLISFKDEKENVGFIESVYYLNEGDVVKDESLAEKKMSEYDLEGDERLLFAIMEEPEKRRINKSGFYFFDIINITWEYVGDCYLKGEHYIMPYSNLPAEMECNLADPFINELANQL